MNPPPILRGLVNALAEALGSGCPKGCMRNAVMCRVFAPDFKLGLEETHAQILARAAADPCRCWCHSIQFAVWRGALTVSRKASVEQGQGDGR